MRFWIKLSGFVLIGYLMFSVSFMRADYAACMAAQKNFEAASAMVRSDADCQSAANVAKLRQAFTAYLAAEKQWTADAEWFF